MLYHSRGDAFTFILFKSFRWVLPFTPYKGSYILHTHFFRQLLRRSIPPWFLVIIPFLPFLSIMAFEMENIFNQISTIFFSSTCRISILEFIRLRDVLEFLYIFLAVILLATWWLTFNTILNHSLQNWLLIESNVPLFKLRRLRSDARTEPKKIVNYPPHFNLLRQRTYVVARANFETLIMRHERIGRIYVE